MWTLFTKRRSTARLPTRAHPPALTDLTAHWLPFSRVDTHMAMVHHSWAKVAPERDLQRLCEVRMLIWLGSRGLDPMPRLVVAATGETVVGVAAVYACPLHRSVRLEQWAIHPLLEQLKHEGATVLTALLECAEEWSLEEGWYGRVLAPVEVIPAHWRGPLAFREKDPWTLLRAGPLYGR